MATVSVNTPSAYRNYQKTQIETASPARLLLMLYDGAIRKLHEARTFTVDNNIPKAHEHLVKVQDILVELMLALDHNVGGEVSRNLERLYEYMYNRLVEANVKRDPERIEEVCRLLSDLREGWRAAVTSRDNDFERTDTEPAKPTAQVVPMAARPPVAPATSTGASAPSTPSSPPGPSLNISG